MGERGTTGFATVANQNILHFFFPVEPKRTRFSPRRAGTTRTKWEKQNETVALLYDGLQRPDRFRSPLLQSSRLVRVSLILQDEATRDVKYSSVSWQLFTSIDIQSV